MSTDIKVSRNPDCSIKSIKASEFLIENDPRQFKTPFTWLISGARGSGKSTLVYNILTRKFLFKRYFHRIFIFSRTFKLDEKMSKVAKMIQNGGVYDTISPQMIERIVDEQRLRTEQFMQLCALGVDENDNPRPPKTLIILDDMIADPIFSNEKSNIMNRLVFNARHFSISLIITTQKYNACPLSIRTNVQILSIFRSDNKKEKKAIFDEISFIDTDKLKDLYEFATNVEFGFLTINFGEPNINKRFLSNLDIMNFE